MKRFEILETLALMAAEILFKEAPEFTTGIS